MSAAVIRRAAQTLSLILLCSPAIAQLDHRQIEFSLPGNAEKLVVADVTGDGLNELISVVDHSLRVYVQTEQGFDFANGYSELTFDEDSIGWDISRGHQQDDQASIVTLHNGSSARLWTIASDLAVSSTTIAENLPGFISKGVNRLHFSRDINNDGAADLIIPGAGVINILVNSGDGNLQPPLTIRSDIRLRTQLNINRFNRSAGQAVRIPVLELRDTNGDGAEDLVSRTEELLAVFLANPKGAPYFPTTPSYAIDILEIEERLGEFDIDNLDFSNLTGILALTHEEILEDVNGDGAEDLLTREGGKVSLFLGNPNGMTLEQPQQVLRSGGNVLSTFLYDENEDGLKDLWLWRVEPISVGDIFVWLALSGSVAIEAFIYPNDGERFSRRPSRKVTIDLKFPSVLRLANAYEDLSNQARELDDQPAQPSITANVNAQIDQADLLVLANNQLQIFLDTIQPEPESEDSDFLGGLGYNRERDSYEIDIREIIENVAFEDEQYLQTIATNTPDDTLELSSSINNGDLIATNLNNDGLDDLFVFTGHDASQIQGILLLSN